MFKGGGILTVLLCRMSKQFLLFETWNSFNKCIGIGGESPQRRITVVRSSSRPCLKHSCSRFSRNSSVMPALFLFFLSITASLPVYIFFKPSSLCGCVHAKCASVFFALGMRI